MKSDFRLFALQTRSSPYCSLPRGRRLEFKPVSFTTSVLQKNAYFSLQLRFASLYLAAPSQFMKISTSFLVKARFNKQMCIAETLAYAAGFLSLPYIRRIFFFFFFMEITSCRVSQNLHSHSGHTRESYILLILYKKGQSACVDCPHAISRWKPRRTNFAD